VSFSFYRERHEANVLTGPPRMLDRRALAACCAETLVGCFLAQRILSEPNDGAWLPAASEGRYCLFCDPRSSGCLMKLFILGGTGNSGQRLVRMALDRSHQVTAFVRDREKLASKLGGFASNGLKIITGAIDDSGVSANTATVTKVGTFVNTATLTKVGSTVNTATLTKVDRNADPAIEEMRRSTRFKVSLDLSHGWND
jgi:hypothetical protein